MRAPLIRRNWDSEAPISSWSSRRALPAIVALGPRVSPIKVIAHTDLPEPDSPTIARTSAGRSSKDTPATACTSPSRVAKDTLRSRTSSRL